MSEQINVRLAYETLARIMAQAANSEVTVEIERRHECKSYKSTRSSETKSRR